MREKRRNGRVAAKTSVEEEIAHLRGLDLKGFARDGIACSATSARSSAAASAVLHHRYRIQATASAI